MRYRRHETLRYSLEHPIEATYKIVKVGGRSIQSSMGEANILDLSPGGMRISSPFHISLEKKVQFFVEASIAGIDIAITADGIWCKKVRGRYQYGLDFLEDYNEEVVKALKEYRKKQHQ